MRKTILLVAVCLVLVLPSALALNCTIYKGDKRELCKNIDPLDISEKEKKDLMKDNIYGTIQTPNPSVNIQLNTNNSPNVTLETIYEEKIVFISRFLLFILFNYFLFSVLTKSSWVKKWLHVDY